MNKTQGKRAGFSLVELVIVIVILGIIAAIAIPRISSGSKNAGESALRANLATLRSAVDWYYGEHKNNFPGAKSDGANAANTEKAFVNQLILYSDVDGGVSTAKDAAHPCGPYLRGSFPTLPVGLNASKATVTVVPDATPLTATPGDGTGWKYSTGTGQIIANVTETGADNITYDKY